jgi:hypothetical protein
MNKIILFIFFFIGLETSHAQVKTGSGGGHDEEKYGKDIEVFGEKKSEEQIKIIFTRKDFKNVGLSSGENSLVLKTTIPTLLNEIRDEFNSTWGKCHNKKAKNSKQMLDNLPSVIFQEQIANVDLSTRIIEFKIQCKLNDQEDRQMSSRKTKQKSCVYRSELSTRIDFLLLFAQKNLIKHLQDDGKKTPEEAHSALTALKLLSEINLEKVNEK